MRTYKPVKRIEKTCACGCGRKFTGRRDKIWATGYCKLKGHIMRERAAVAEAQKIIASASRSPAEQSQQPSRGRSH